MLREPSQKAFGQCLTVMAQQSALQTFMTVNRGAGCGQRQGMTYHSSEGHLTELTGQVDVAEPISGHYNPRNDVILRLEHINARQTKASTVWSLLRHAASPDLSQLLDISRLHRWLRTASLLLYVVSDVQPATVIWHSSSSHPGVAC